MLIKEIKFTFYTEYYDGSLNGNLRCDVLHNCAIILLKVTVCPQKIFLKSVMLRTVIQQ